MLNPIEEVRFAELKAMCRELKVPTPPEIMIGLKVHDKNGVLTFDDVQRGHSWTRNAYNFMFCSASKPTAAGASFAAGYLTHKATGGAIGVTNLNHASERVTLIVPGALGNDTYGIVVGTDDTEFSPEQYDLIAKIAQGVGTGQFSYTAGVVDAGGYTGGTTTWKTTEYRIFNNNSGDPITVKEVGIIAYAYNSGAFYLFERSVLDPTVAVANGAQLTVTYEISMSFAAID
jgi:hypothetical protein